MVSNILLSPEISSNIIGQTTQMSYILRNLARISGEEIGLPQSIPNHRKADYLFRDYYMTFVMTSMMDISTRIAESKNVMPSQIKLMRLNRMQSLYPQGGLHTPNLPNFFQVQNYTREYPEYIRNYILGSSVNPRSYWLVPELIEKKVIPDMMRKYEHPQRIAEARLFAHHLRRLFTPDHYIDNFLVTSGRINATDAKLLKDHLGRFDQFLKAYETAHKEKNTQALTTLFKDFAAQLPSKEAPWLHRMAKLEEKELIEMIQGPNIQTIFERMGKQGIKKTFRDYKRALVLHPDRFMLKVDQHVLRPFLEKIAPNSNTLPELAKDFSLNKIRANQAISVFKASELWLKIPLSFAMLTVVYGLVSGVIDVKYVQAFQDQMVKLRGDSKETVMPTYIGTIAGLALGFMLYRTKAVRSLGHIGSYITAALGYNVGQIATTSWLLKRKLNSPRNAESKPYQIMMTPNWYQAQALQSNATGASDIKAPRMKD